MITQHWHHCHLSKKFESRHNTKQTAMETFSNQGSHQLLNTNKPEKETTFFCHTFPPQNTMNPSAILRAQRTKLKKKQSNACLLCCPTLRQKTTVTPTTAKDPPSTQPHLPNPAKVLRMQNGFITISLNSILTTASCKSSEGDRWDIQSIDDGNEVREPSHRNWDLAGSRTTFFPITCASNRLIDVSYISPETIPASSTMDNIALCFAPTIMLTIKTFDVKSLPGYKFLVPSTKYYCYCDKFPMMVRTHKVGEGQWSCK